MPSLKIQISIPDHYAGELKDHAVRGESHSQTARRLLLDILDREDDSPQPSPEIPSDIGDRLDKLERQLDWAKREILDSREKFKAIDHDLYYGESLSFKEIRQEIKRLETAIKPPSGETAIMIEKKPRQRRAKNERLEA